MNTDFDYNYPRDSSNVVKNVTSIKKENFTFIWSIEQCGEFLDRKYEVSSPAFFSNSKQESKWQLILFTRHAYPEGLQVALRLHKVSTDDKCFSVVYTISVTDIHGKDQQLLTKENLFRNYYDYDECLIASSSKVKDKFLQNNGTLIIKCKIDLLFGENPDDIKSDSLKSPDKIEGVNIPVTNDFSVLSYQKSQEFEKNTNSLPTTNDLSNANIFQKSSQREKVCNDEMLDMDINYCKAAEKMDNTQYNEGNFKRNKSSKTLSDNYGKKPDVLSEKTVSFLNASKGRSKKEKDPGNSKNLLILSDDLNFLYSSKYHYDITILTDDGRIRAHKAILTARSEYFRRTLRQDENEIHIQGMDTATLDSVLYYMYTGQSPKMTFDLAIDILSACHVLRLDHLKAIAENSLKSQINISNVTDVFHISQSMKLDDLKISALMFVAKNREAVTKTPKWDQMMRDDPYAAGEILLTIASYQKTSTKPTW